VTAKDILTDDALRQKYDALIKAKLARLARQNQRSSKQREMMDKLLAGEEAHRKQREAER
jgi:bacterioferritin (cytochrome b1)